MIWLFCGVVDAVAIVLFKLPANTQGANKHRKGREKGGKTTYWQGAQKKRGEQWQLNMRRVESNT